MGDAARSWGARLAMRPHAVAAALLGACVLAYLWPVLVGGKILSPMADLYAATPWRGLAPVGVDRYLNSLLVDLPMVDYPWRVLARRFLHDGTFPAWNPYAMSGIPFWSNPQTGLFSPFNVPLWLLPLTYGLGVSAALKLFAGALGAYLLVRQLRLALLPGVAAGIAFAFCAVNIVWLAHETLPGVVVMAPWALWLVERIFERGRVGSAIGLAVVVAVGLGGGHPGMQVHLLAVVAAYALVRVACLRGAARDEMPSGGSRPSLPHALALVGGGLVAGVLLMAFMLLPEALSSRDTVGVAARQNGAFPSTRMPFAAIATTIFPDWWGRPTGAETPTTVANQAILVVNYNERTFYAGTVALLLALVGLVSPGAWRSKLPFALVGAGALAVAVHVPGLYWLARHLPVLRLVEPERIHFGFALGVAVLAAFGLQAVLDAPPSERRRLAIVLSALGVAAAAALAVKPSAADLQHTVEHFRTGTSFAVGDVLALTAIAWFALFALAVGALLVLLRARPGWRAGIAAALVLLALADVFRFIHGYQPMGPAAVVIPPDPPSIRFLEQHRDEGRIAGLGPALPADAGIVHGLRDVRGYDPPHPTQRMLNLWRLLNPYQAGWLGLELPALGPQQLRVLGVLGVRYVVADPGTRVPRRELPQLTTAYAGPDATVLESHRLMPRAFVPEHVAVTADEAATAAAIVGAGFDVRTDVAVERDQPGAARLAGARGEAAIVEERNARVTLRARLDSPGLVVLGDSLMDGWSVQVDGKPAEALHVNGVMRGTAVPAGRHDVVWSYRVPGLRLGALVSGLTLAVLTAAVAGLALRSRRRSFPNLSR